MLRARTACCWIFAALIALPGIPRAVAQKNPADEITEEDKKVFRDFMNAVGKLRKVENHKAIQAYAISHLRQIGLAMFEFETEYGSFPSEDTAALVKEATGTKLKLGAATANDCFLQLIAAGILDTDRIFSVTPRPKADEPKQPDLLEKCTFSYLAGMTAAGNPSRPLVVGPLVNGETTFDPQVLGGRAVVLCVDNSVRAFPIEEDGRVLINGLDIFDPAQPFWGGEVPPILWPRK